MSDQLTIVDFINNGNLEQVKLLLENRPDIVNTTFSDGYTPLHIAAQHGDGEIIKLLLENKADINAVTHDGCTPMELAIKAGHDAAKWFSL